MYEGQRLKFWTTNTTSKDFVRSYSKTDNHYFIIKKICSVFTCKKINIFQMICFIVLFYSNILQQLKCHYYENIKLQDSICRVLSVCICTIYRVSPMCVLSIQYFVFLTLQITVTCSQKTMSQSTPLPLPDYLLVSCHLPRAFHQHGCL